MSKKCKNIFVIITVILVCCIVIFLAAFFGITVYVLFTWGLFLTGFIFILVISAYTLDALNEIFLINKILTFDFSRETIFNYDRKTGEIIMANCCNNWVEVSGDKEQVDKFVKLVGKEFDFNKVIPIDSNSKDEADKKWGCTSIAFDTEFEFNGDDSANWFFWTKWNPPTFVYQKLCELFPDVFIYWRYEEPGCDLYGYLNTDDI